MLLSYQECLEQYGSDYNIKKLVADGKLFVQEKGVYSDKENVSELEIIAKKYPKAIITLHSAFYYHGLVDIRPGNIHVATPKNARKISDSRVKQIYENSEAFDMGKTIIECDGVDVMIYDKERLLVELVRNKRRFSDSMYAQLLNSYRRIIQDLSIPKVTEYAQHLPKTNMVIETINKEILGIPGTNAVATFRHRTLEERAAEYGGMLMLESEYDWGEPVGREVW